jgi:hypothetical protein
MANPFESQDSNNHNHFEMAVIPNGRKRLPAV